MLRHQLRQSDPAEDLQRLLPAERQTQLAGVRYRPAMILTYLGEWVRQRKNEGLYGEITAAAFDQNLGILSDVLGGCERLTNTLLPYPYAIMIHRTIYLYCFLLPFGLVGSLGVMTPVISVLVGYTFMALETMSVSIEDTMREMIGQPLREGERETPDWFAL